MTVKSFHELVVWQRGMGLPECIYTTTATFPADERFGLISQLRRAAVSIPSNIAEGQSRHSTGEFLQFLSIARGSLAELETQLILAHRLGMLASDQQEELLQSVKELGAMLGGLVNSLRR